MPTRLLSVVLLGAAIVIAVIGLGPWLDGRPPLYRQHQVRVYSHAVPLADYTIFDKNGQAHHLGEFTGKIVVLAFWAPWCPYCATEIPALQHFYQGIEEEQAFMVIPVTTINETRASVEDFYQRHDLTEKQMPVYYIDEPGLHRVLDVKGYPHFVVVDAQGHARAKIRPDWSRRQEVMSLIRQIAAEKLQP